MQEPIVSQQMPVLALRGIVVYPAQTVHFDIARERWKRPWNRIRP